MTVYRRSTTTMTVTTDTGNMADTIDTRDIAERLDELNQLIDEAIGISEDRDELIAEARILTELINEIGPEAYDGVTLIRDSYLKEYAMELADEIGAVPNTYTWPTSCIDWDQAARELQYDYSAVDYDGVTYWFSN